ncbi:MAG TPA: hypothetical protein VFO93_00320 [Hymenobacter sp.]|uniref:hypothetical protein n=1 Tax=Hymenobacter sp. TaxID=1898978 RepID=UPI002D80D701|nr:hypothetical protein [Hymenobacter sp.]HET9501952.1 hypothetical protein [Hymenobacter sp.]
MTNLSVPASPKPGLWHWLLRTTGLEAWFQQAPAAAHAGREERLVLLAALPNTTRLTRSAHTAMMAEALRECQPAIGASGGVVMPHQPGSLLLTWPAASAPAVSITAIYTQLRDCVRRLAGAPALPLNAAAGLGWVAPGAAATPRQYEPVALREVAGLLHESQQLGSDLLVTAALHQRLAPEATGPCELHVAFGVPGHRYPATVYRVAAPAGSPPVAATAAKDLQPPFGKKYSY